MEACNKKVFMINKDLEKIKFMETHSFNTYYIIIQKINP